MSAAPGGEGPDGPLADPVVPPDVYDAEYYLNWCAGYEEWRDSGGARFAGIYPGSLARANFKAGERLVDIGTGRGELLAAAVELCDAQSAIGIEYSPDAVAMAQQTIEQHGAAPRAQVLLADARRIPLEDGCADLVTMLDVVEHLAPQELESSLREARRLLRPGGRLLVHTAPNRTVYEVTYRLQRMLPWRRGWPADPRNDFERLMHVNEQTVGSLRQAIQEAGFQEVRTAVGAWVYRGFLPSRRAGASYPLLARLPLLRRLAVFDLWGEARRPA